MVTYYYYTVLLSLIIFCNIINIDHGDKIDAQTIPYQDFQKYIDKFYIATNQQLIYIFFKSLIYFFLTILIFIFLRLLAIGDIQILTKINTINGYNLLLGVLILIIFIIFHHLLSKFFTKDLITIYIYLLQYKYFQKYCEMLSYDYVTSCYKQIKILCYRIATNTYNPAMFNEDFDNYYNKQIDCQELWYTIKQPFLSNIIYIISNIVKNYNFLQYIFYKIYRIFFILDWSNMYRPFKYTPFFLMILVVINDIVNGYFFYIYYYLFFFLCYQKFIAHKFFLGNIYITLLHVSIYFYNNDLPYKEQRPYIFSDSIILLKNSSANKWLKTYWSFTDSGNIKELFISNFSLTNKFDDKALNNLYIRNNIIYLLLIFFFFFVDNIGSHISIYFIDYKINNYYFNILTMVLLIFISNKAYYWAEDTYNKNTMHEGRHREINNNYKIIFWIILPCQVYLLWLTIFFPIFFFHTEILINTSWLKIIKIISDNEKILYIYQYLDMMMPQYSLTIEEKDYIRFLLRKIDFSHYNLSFYNVKDLQLYVQLFIENNIMHTNINEYLIYHYVQCILFHQRPYLDNVGLIKVILGIGVTISLIQYYHNFFFLIYTVTGKIALANKMLIMASKKYPIFQYKGINILKESSIIIKGIINKIIEFLL